jgi:hypothetical protein
MLREAETVDRALVRDARSAGMLDAQPAPGQ